MTSTTTDSTYIMALRIPSKMLSKMDKRIAAENRKSVDMDINRSSFVRNLIVDALNKQNSSAA